MKVTFVATLSLIFSLAIFAPSALSHGSLEPKHGGIVQEAHDMVFEVVRAEDSTSLYIRDHDKDYPTGSLSGSIIILASGEKTEMSLTPSGGNKMTAKAIISDGAKVLIRVIEGDHHPVTIRYSF